MALLFGILSVAAIITALFILPVFHYWRRLGDDDEFTSEEWPLFRRWVWAGTLVPFLAWIFVNTGLLAAPVWPDVVPVSAGVGKWWNSFAELALSSALLISSWWGGISFAWLLGRVFARVGNRRHFYILCGLWLVLLGPLALLILAGGGWFASGLALLACGLPLVHVTLNLKREKPLQPSYSRALAKINFGKYDEAEKEVIAELEQCEDDFDGWMMLAELYATHFDDLPGADRTVRDLCAQEATTPVQVSIALHKLAGWHLKIGHDPDGARRSLAEICTRMPGTHLEKMARQRLNQLPATREELFVREQGKPVRLLHVADEQEAPATRALSPEQAAAEANHHVEALKKNPDDVLAREKFARVLAEELGHANAAVEQLQLLLAMPGQPESRRVEWLLTLAGWHARYRNDPEMARLVYQEVLRDFANTPQAFAAQRKISLLDWQAQIRRRAAAGETV